MLKVKRSYVDYDMLCEEVANAMPRSATASQSMLQADPDGL